MTPTFVIAEAASAHDGHLEKARRLVEWAAVAGADMVKFQYWSDPAQLADRRHVPPYYREFYHRYAVPRPWLDLLARECEAHAIEFGCTVFLPGDAAHVAPYVQRFKISSFEALDRRLFDDVRAVAAGRPILISTGMQTPVELAALVGHLGPHRAQVRLLHCVSAYPAPLAHLQLAALRWRFAGEWRLHGYSDHSGDVRAGAWAVAAGAEIVETHMRLIDTDPDNPDAGTFALSPVLLAGYVANIRDVEQAFGASARRQVQACEGAMLPYRVVV